ncbi:uncharacterized protein [Venturia canescens]|uniref:uncharacterized protein n=1 Tax=Venturia canescens TaxID=32260 RepID=UPI001C9D13E2|nr:uncharacterized protein LOC122411981 [Venturia canescens]
MKNFVHLVTVNFLFLATIAHASNNSSVANLIKDKCGCDYHACGCCEYIKWAETGLDGNVCTNFSYLHQNIGIAVTITWNNFTALNTTISAADIPLNCFGIPGIEISRFHICWKLHDFSFNLDNLYGCIKLSVSALGKVQKLIDFGCYNISKESIGETYAKGKRRVLEIMDEYTKLLNFWKKTDSATNDLEAVMIALIDGVPDEESKASSFYFSLEPTAYCFFCLFVCSIHVFLIFGNSIGNW